MNQHRKLLSALSAEFNEPIRDSLWQNIYFASSFRKIINHPTVQKLGRIKQLGPTFHVYPGATHTRLNHSFGVFYLAKRIIEHLIQFEECPELSFEGVYSFLCGALLHDLGHFPFAHSLKELPLKDHEQLTGEVILGSDLFPIINAAPHINPEMAAAIVDETIPTGNSEIQFYRNILSGVMDPDKLDYLNRDAHFCGVPYGLQDFDFIIHKMFPLENRIGILDEGITGIENVLFSKYLMYRSVYWHKGVRCATAMIKKALQNGLQSGIISAEELYGLDDEEFYLNIGSRKFPSSELFTMVRNRSLYKTVYTCSFDTSKEKHLALVPLDNRLAEEKKLSEQLSLPDSLKDYGIIIDIPENISFEVDVPIISDKTVLTFTEADSVFSGDTVNGFVSSIRKIRIFMHPDAISRIPKGFFEQWNC